MGWASLWASWICECMCYHPSWPGRKGGALCAFCLGDAGENLCTMIWAHPGWMGGPQCQGAPHPPKTNAMSGACDVPAAAWGSLHKEADRPAASTGCCCALAGGWACAVRRQAGIAPRSSSPLLILPCSACYSLAPCYSPTHSLPPAATPLPAPAAQVLRRSRLLPSQSAWEPARLHGGREGLLR